VTEAIRDVIDIAAPPEDVFSVASDFSSYSDWNANIARVEVLERDDAGRGTKVWMEVDAKLKMLTYTLAYYYTEAPRSFSWTLVDGDVEELEGSYEFEGRGGVTKVAYEMRVDPGFPIPGFLRRQAERQIARAALEDLKRRVETITST
jgi:ribosome-associated toxin RatA of RatAB toxin-antitoxin module